MCCDIISPLNFCALCHIARMDIVLDEWCTDHYEYILYAVLRHCGRASRGWGEVLATEVSTAAFL